MDEKDIIIAQLRQRIAALEAEIARRKKNSSNSSKPPSSDIVKPPKPRPTGKRNRKRKRGGQFGHRKHTGLAFGPKQVEEVFAYELHDTAGFEPLDDWRVLQQVELVDRPFVITEHRARRYRCLRTGKIVTAALPTEVTAAGLLGRRRSALVAYQKGACHMSYTTIHTFLADVLGLAVSTGQLAKVAAKISDALASPYAELADALPAQPYVGSDETGHKDAGRKFWTWCLRARRFTLMLLESPRGGDVPAPKGVAPTAEALTEALGRATEVVKTAAAEHDPADWCRVPDQPRQGPWGDEPTLIRVSRPLNDFASHLGSIRTIRRMLGRPAEGTQ